MEYKIKYIELQHKFFAKNNNGKIWKITGKFNLNFKFNKKRIFNKKYNTLFFVSDKYLMSQ